MGGIGALSEADLYAYFATWGTVASVQVMRSRDVQPRGFGFVTFTAPEPVSAWSCWLTIDNLES